MLGGRSCDNGAGEIDLDRPGVCLYKVEIADIPSWVMSTISSPKPKHFLLTGLWIFLALFLFYPLAYVLQGAFFIPRADGSGIGFSLQYFQLLFTNELYLRSFFNSFSIAIAATIVCLLISVPLALAYSRYTFPGKTLLQGAMLIPIILPPFVGAIGIKHFFARYGSLNLLLMHWGILPWDGPIDWFGNGGVGGVIVMEVLHLFPIMFLSMAASLANIDPSMRDAAANLGAKPFYLFRTVTLPLAMPGIFAGASIVFVSAFTDLGTPLIFDFQATIPSQIFNASTEAGDNPIGNALVVTTLVIVGGLFILGKKFGDAGSYAMMGRSATHTAEIPMSPLAGWGVTIASVALLLAALMPHVGVIVNSFAAHWAMTILPSEWSAKYYAEVFTNDTTTKVIGNSLYYSIGSASVD
ncbi:MAG: ABC transporter permease, partial [Candidatus Methylacidiphilales bacterium]